MREGWTYKKLGEITKVINGLWIGKKPPLKTVAVIRNTNFTKDCKLSTTNIAYIDVEEKQFEKKRLLQGDIIIEKSGGSEKQPVGRPILFNLIGGEFSFSNFTSVIRIDNPNEIISPFLHLALYGAYLRGETLKMQAKTTGIHNLDFKAYNRILIPIPSLQEQQQIVSELDLLSSVIEKQKTQIEELDKLAQSIFYDMFGDPVENEKGWEVKKLSEVAPQTEYKGEISNEDGKFWLLNLDMVKSQTGEIINKCLFEKEEIGNSTISFNEDNVLYSKLRPYLNKVVLPQESGYGTSELVPLKPDPSRLNRVFLALLLRSKQFVEYINIKVQGAKMPRVSMTVLRSFPIILPPLSLQQEFADKIQAIESMKAKVRQSLKESETLFNSRMDFYFS